MRSSSLANARDLCASSSSSRAIWVALVSRSLLREACSFWTSSTSCEICTHTQSSSTSCEICTHTQSSLPQRHCSCVHTKRFSVWRCERAPALKRRARGRDDYVTLLPAHCWPRHDRAQLQQLFNHCVFRRRIIVSLRLSALLCPGLYCSVIENWSTALKWAAAPPPPPPPPPSTGLMQDGACLRFNIARFMTNNGRLYSSKTAFMQLTDKRYGGSWAEIHLCNCGSLLMRVAGQIEVQKHEYWTALVHC